DGHLRLLGGGPSLRALRPGGPPARGAGVRPPGRGHDDGAGGRFPRRPVLTPAARVAAAGSPPRTRARSFKAGAGAPRGAPRGGRGGRRRAGAEVWDGERHGAPRDGLGREDGRGGGVHRAVDVELRRAATENGVAEGGVDVVVGVAVAAAPRFRRGVQALVPPI